MAKRRELWGFWYDPDTKHVYTSEESLVPVNHWTFEDLWFKYSPIFFFKKDIPLAFFYTPTEATAFSVFDWARKLVGNNAALRLQKEPVKQSLTGTWTHPEFSIYAGKVANNENPETDAFSVGLIANSILRHGADNNSWAARSFISELQQQGAWLGA